MTSSEEQSGVTLNNAQKKYLRKLSHDLSALVYIGKEGLTPTVIEAINTALLSRELIKVKLINTDTISKHEAAERVPKETDCILVQLIGKTLLVYRPNPKRKKEDRIRLP